MTTDIFKLIFHHDQRLDKLDQESTHENPKKRESSLQDFMKPDPTYSRFYFTGTDLNEECFGLNVLSAYKELIRALETAFHDKRAFTQRSEYSSFEQAIEDLNIGETIIITDETEFRYNISELHLNNDFNDSHYKGALRKAIEDDHIVLYKVRSKDGFDLQMFSKKNVYRDMFFPLQKLVPDHFRFFSINGKKFNTERHFYFETWTLDRPPHGFEEVHPETVL